MIELRERRLLVVTGKGGVGKTTTACTLALSAAERGKRVLLVELAGSHALPSHFGLEGRAYEPRRAAEGVDVASLTAEECMRDFSRRKLRLDAIGRALFNNRISRSFVDAVPGLHDILQLGKIENLLMEPMKGDVHYDLVVLDAPATGHGMTLLEAPRSLAEVTRVGPFFELAATIRRFMSDPALMGLVVVTLPQPLPVNETLQLVDGLPREDRRVLGAVVLNEWRGSPWPAGVHWPQVRAALTASGAEGIEDWLSLGDRAQEKQALQQQALERLTNIDCPVLAQPWAGKRDLDAAALQRLASALSPAEAS